MKSRKEDKDKSDKLKEILEEIDLDRDLPMLPQVIARINMITTDDRAGTADLAKVILEDQALTSKILRVANSSYYILSTREKVSTISQAIVLLGFETINKVAIGLSAYNLLGKFLKSKLLKGFWEHSVGCAVCSQMLAESTKLKFNEEAFVAGLLHDIGKLILACHLPKPYAEVMERVSKGSSYYWAEQEVIGTDHCEVGEEVARRWNFPTSLTEPIRGHHGESKSQVHLVNIIRVGDLMARRIFGGDKRISLTRLFDRAFLLLSLERREMEEILMTLSERVKEIEETFQITLKELTSYTLLVEEENLRLASQLSRAPQSVQELLLADIYRLGSKIVEGIEANIAFQLTLEGILASTECDLAILALVEKGEIVGKMGIGSDAEAIAKGLRIPSRPGEGVLALTVIRKQPFNVIDVTSPLYESILSSEDKERLDLVSFATAPICLQGEAVGVVVAGSHSVDHTIDDEQMQSILIFCNFASLALEKALLGARKKKGPA